MPSPTITVYSKPECVQCDRTKKYLDEKVPHPYTILDVTQDPEALEMVKSLGYQQAPVVVVDDEHWSGFRPDLLRKLIPSPVAEFN